MPETNSEVKPLTLTETIVKAESEVRPVEQKIEFVETPKGGDSKLEAKGEELEDGLTKQEVTEAKNLMKLLKDPEQAPLIIDVLAKQAGYSKAELKKVETPEQVKELKEDLLIELEGLYGEDIAGKIFKSLKKSIDTQVEQRTQDIRAKNEEQEISRLEGQANKVIASFREKFYDGEPLPDKVESEMSKLMDKYPPAKGVTTREWMEDLHILARQRVGLENTSSKSSTATKAAKIERNRNDAPNRVSSGRSPVPSAESGPAQFKSLADAVQAAMDKVKAEQ